MLTDEIVFNIFMVSHCEKALLYLCFHCLSLLEANGWSLNKTEFFNCIYSFLQQVCKSSITSNQIHNFYYKNYIQTKFFSDFLDPFFEILSKQLSINVENLSSLFPNSIVFNQNFKVIVGQKDQCIHSLQEEVSRLKEENSRLKGRNSR